MKTIYEVVEAEPYLVAIDGFSEFALLSETDTEWNGSFVEQLSDPVAIELYQTLKEKLMDDGYYREEPFAPLRFEIPLKNRLMYTSATCQEVYARASMTANEAWWAMKQDYPQLYWAYGVSMGICTYENASGDGRVSEIDYEIGDGDQYYENCSTGTTGDETLRAYQEAVARIVEQARKEAGDDRYKLVKYFHDYLCEELSYDNEAAGADKSNLSQYLYAHTSVPAFIGYKDKGKKVVCEGYAKALKVLCDKVGIPCVLVSGMGGIGDSKGAHMWNYVQMEDDQWYLVDATWDDQGMEIYDTYFPVSYTHLRAHET